jgi:hypothetical protein
MLSVDGNLLKRRLTPTLYNFILTFSELAVHDFLLAPHQNIDIPAK